MGGGKKEKKEINKTKKSLKKRKRNSKILFIIFIFIIIFLFIFFLLSLFRFRYPKLLILGLVAVFGLRKRDEVNGEKTKEQKRISGEAWNTKIHRRRRTNVEKEPKDIASGRSRGWKKKKKKKKRNLERESVVGTKKKKNIIIQKYDNGNVKRCFGERREEKNIQRRLINLIEKPRKPKNFFLSFSFFFFFFEISKSIALDFLYIYILLFLLFLR